MSYLFKCYNTRNGHYNQQQFTILGVRNIVSQYHDTIDDPDDLKNPNLRKPSDKFLPHQNNYT